MSVEECSQVKAAFEAALDRSPADRRAFLAASYPPAVVDLVLDLLEHHQDDAPELPEDPDPNSPTRVFTPGEMVDGRFRIVRYLGSGGIGQVYQAWDERLSAFLALKTLHPRLSHDSQVLDRFRREIHISREVAHPNLCRVFDLVQHHRGNEKIACLTMELLSGQNLAEYLRNRRPLSTAEALILLRPIAGGLTALHEHGIVHRDLKPSNVMLVLGWGACPRVVVTDFGLAKPVESGLALFESSVSTVAGSPYFMAPELWDGVRPGISSDVYALGLIADEIVTKSTAFETSSLPAFYYSKFHQGPIPPSHRSTNLPVGWERAISRCLDIVPSSRYKSVSEFLSDLEKTIDAPHPETAAILSSSSACKPARAALSIPTIAVLPFTDLSPSRDQEYLCDGLAEELIHLLSQIRSLRVVARASAFQFQSGSFSIQEIASKLNATYVLSGSVRRASDRLRVTIQLVEAAEGYNLWSQQFDRKIADVFEIQGEIAAASMKSLKGRLGVEYQLPAILVHTSNTEAYKLYLRGLFEFNRQTAPAIEAAASCFARATAASPQFAPAYVGLADCYCTEEWYGLRPASEVIPLALKCAERALALSPALANAHCTLALIKARYEWDWDRAGPEFLQTFALNPGLARAQFCYALDYLTPLGRLDEALRVVQSALELDPLSNILHTAVGGCLYRQRLYAAAEKSLRNTLGIHADFYHAHWSLARVLEQLGRFEEAVHEYEAAFCGNPENPMILAELGHCYGVMGNQKLAHAIVSRLEEFRSKRYVPPLCDAFLHLGFSQRGEALVSIENAVGQRTGALVWLAVDPRLDSLHAEPGLRRILARMRLPG